MKGTIVKKYLRFSDHTEQEIQAVCQRFTWKDYEGNFSTIIHKDTDGSYYSYWGLYKAIKIFFPWVEIINEPKPYPLKSPVPTNMFEGIELFDFQQASIEKSITFRYGINNLPTGTGKSFCILGAVRYLLNNNKINRGLIIVPSIILAEQFITFAEQLGFTHDEIGAYHSMKKDKSKVLVAVVNSAVNLDDLSSINFLAFDECHFASSDMYRSIILSAINTEYLLGYSGSPFSSDDIFKNEKDTLLYSLLGGPIFEISHKYMRDNGFIAEPIVYFKEVPGKMYAYPARFDRIYTNHIVNNKPRNDIAIEYTKRFIEKGQKVLILAIRLEHAKKLMEELKDYKCISVFGNNAGLKFGYDGKPKKCFIDYDQFRKDFDDYEVVIGSPVLQFGVDFPSVNAVIMIGGYKSKIMFLQRLGRGLRKKKTGKNQVFVLDFDDKSHVYLHSHSKKRRELYRQIQVNMIPTEESFLELINNE